MSDLANAVLVIVFAHVLAIGSQPVQFPKAGGFQMLASPAGTGACSATVKGGRSFVTGGSDGAGSLATARYFEREGQFTPAVPMSTGRTGHVCVALTDGTVLVAGGETVKGALAPAAEVFHPTTNTWTTAGPMVTPRRRASVVLLRNGMALVVGGEAAGQAVNTLELYDPAQGRFQQEAGTLSVSPTSFALAVLDDGRVVIAGGVNRELAQDSIYLFDPDHGVTYAGRMWTPRANFTATTLANGHVLFAGGTDGYRALASAELFDPATGQTTLTEPLASPRQNHMAVRPAVGDRVLIAWGSAEGHPIDSAEYFVPVTKSFEPAREPGPADNAARRITVAILNTDATIRALRTYLVTPP